MKYQLALISAEPTTDGGVFQVSANIEARNALIALDELAPQLRRTMVAGGLTADAPNRATRRARAPR